MVWSVFYLSKEEVPSSLTSCPYENFQGREAFQHVTADILELPVTYKGNQYVLVVEDYFTNFVKGELCYFEH